jgi:hypothetical protein
MTRAGIAADPPSFVGVRAGRTLRVRIKFRLWWYQVQFLGFFSELVHENLIDIQ